MEGERKRVVSFEDMEVFQRAYRVSLEIHRASLTFPAVEQRALADQIRRASKSICANLAEGYGRQKGRRRNLPALSGWRSVRRMRCGYGCAMPWISANRRADMARVAGGVSSDHADASEPCRQGVKIRHLSSVFCPPKR